MAAEYSAIKCFRYLVINGASLDRVMTHAIRGGNIEIMEIISQYGVQPSQKNVKTAIKWHRIEIFDWLVEGFRFEIPETALIFYRFCHGFDYVDEMCLWDLVKLSNDSKLTPVFNNFICNEKFKEYPQILLEELLTNIFEKPAEDNSIDQMKRIANSFYYNLEILIAVAITHENIEMVKYMLKFPSVNVAKHIINNRHGNIINSAIRTKNMEIIELIMNHTSFDPNGNEIDNPPLYHAIDKDYLEMVEKLLGFPKIDVNKKSFYSLLSIAIYKGNKEIIELLINHPDIDVNSNEKEPPLCMACEKENVEIVKRLLTLPQINVNYSFPLIKAI